VGAQPGRNAGAGSRSPRRPDIWRSVDPRVQTGFMTADLEESTQLQLDFGKLDGISGQHVLPCVVQDANTQEVILVAYVNGQALSESIRTRTATFWSTSRDELWVKGATSGETFELVEVLVNCEQNSLLYRVRPQRGGGCHTKNRDRSPGNCFYRRLDLHTGALELLDP
jgi:phosphoribosyl-AMP cyclohydrolase